MVVAIAGGHGKIGLRLTTLLAERGDRVLSLIRDPAQADHVSTAGGEPVVVDLEDAGADELAGGIQGADAVVFAAGAGPGSGAERKLTLDRDGAILLADAAKAANARRYVMVSSMGADPPHPGDEVFDVYLRAKGEADDAVAESGLDCTIVRPGPADRRARNRSRRDRRAASTGARSAATTSRRCWRPRWPSRRRSAGPSSWSAAPTRSRRRSPSSNRRYR